MSNFDIDSSCSHLSPSQKHVLCDVLYDNKDIFVPKDNPSLGFTHVMKHYIHLKDDFVPKHQRPYRLNPDKREVLRHHLQELLNQGIIAPVSAEEDIPISSPIVLVSKKKQNTDHSTVGSKEASLSHYRFCCDFRYLNSQTQQFKYGIRDLQELAESFTNRVPNFITSIDLGSGFFQMGIDEKSSPYTAFNTCFGTYKFLRLPMRLHTAPNSFQLLMDTVLRGLTFQSSLCYLDDVIICSDTFERHLADIREVFARFKDAGLKLGPRKCKFAQTECLFLGHVISRNGVRAPQDRIKAIQDYSPPRSAKSLRRFLGLIGWFRKYIPQFASVVDPLFYLLKKDVKFHWSQTHVDAFQELKDLLLVSPALAYPRYDLEFRIAVDTSSHGIGYMLYQNHPTNDNTDGEPRVVRFGSRSLSKWQRSYGPTKLELLGVTTAVLDCAPYVRGTHFVIECDHQALKPLFQKVLSMTGGWQYYRNSILPSATNLERKCAFQMPCLENQMIEVRRTRPSTVPVRMTPYSHMWRKGR